MNATEACEECTQRCLLNHRQKKDPSPLITSFYKIMYGDYKFKEYLRLPPRVCRIIRGLSDVKNCTLEDCNGKQSTVELGIRDGGLAFTTGWGEFYAEHGLSEGNLVLFNYTPSHFAVRIFNSTCCEKVSFVKANDSNRKRSTTHGNLNAESRKCQKSSDRSTRKQSSTTSSKSTSKDRTQSKFTTNDQSPNSSGLFGQGGRSQRESIPKDNCPASENGNCGFQPASTDTDMIDGDAGCRHDEKRNSLDLSNSKMQIGVDAEGNNGKKSHWSNMFNENSVSKKIVSDELHAEVAARTFPTMSKTKEAVDNNHHDDNPSVPLIYKQARRNADTSMCKEAEIINNDHLHGDPAGRQYKMQVPGHAKSIPVIEKVEVVRNDHHGGNSYGPPLEKKTVVREKSAIKSSTVAKNTNIVGHKEGAEKKKSSGDTLKVPKKELMEGGKMPSGDRNGKSYNEDRIFIGANEGTHVQVKTEPVDSSDDKEAEAYGSSFVVTVESQDLLELPNTIDIWEEDAKESRKIVDLKGPDDRVWPVLYHQKHGVQALTSGWKHFFKTYNLQIGSEYSFTPEDEPGIVYKVEINQ